MEIIFGFIIAGIAVAVVIMVITISIQARKNTLDYEKARQERYDNFICGALVHTHQIAENHAKALLMRRKQLITKDPYGNEIIDKWGQEILGGFKFEVQQNWISL